MFDPTGTGLIGQAMSAITSKPASLEAKQLALHPHFPGAVVAMLHEAGVRRGDTVAVGWTGSFPGFNLSLLAAMDVMKLSPLIVSSVTASQYGANQPELTWLDMESSIRNSGLTNQKSLAATIGGPADCGKGMGDETIELVRAATQRNDVKLLSAKRLRKSIDARMRLMEKQSDGRRIAAYINVGGGTASCGGRECVFPAGVSLNSPRQESRIVDCMLQRYSDKGVPVLHLASPSSLAKHYGISPSSESTNQFPATHNTASRGLAISAFVLICIALRMFVLLDTGDRLLVRLMQSMLRRPAMRVVGQQEGPAVDGMICGRWVLAILCRRRSQSVHLDGFEEVHRLHPLRAC